MKSYEKHLPETNLIQELACFDSTGDVFTAVVVVFA